MGTNSTVYDVDKEYSKKTIKELNQILTQFESSYAKHPEVKFINEHIQYVKMKIAERIGNSKT